MRYLCSEKYVVSQVLLTSVGLRLLHVFLNVAVEPPGQGKAGYSTYPLYFQWKDTTDAQHDTCLKEHHKLINTLSIGLTTSIVYLMTIHSNQKKVQEAQLALPLQKSESCLVLLSKLLLHQG